MLSRGRGREKARAGERVRPAQPSHTNTCHRITPETGSSSRPKPATQHKLGLQVIETHTRMELVNRAPICTSTAWLHISSIAAVVCSAESHLSTANEGIAVRTVWRPGGDWFGLPARNSPADSDHRAPPDAPAGAGGVEIDRVIHNCRSSATVSRSGPKALVQNR